MSDISEKLKTGEFGTAFAELLLVLPIILLVMYGSVEYSRYLRVTESASQLSREIAKQVYKECLASQLIGTDCVTKEIQPPVMHADLPLLQNPQVVITIWRNLGGTDSTGTPPPDFKPVMQIAFPQPAVFPDGSDQANTHYPNPCAANLGPCGIPSPYRPTEAQDPVLYDMILKNVKGLSVVDSSGALQKKPIGGVVIVEVTIPFQVILSGVLPFFHPGVVYEQTIF
jgi:hypothetical protein